MHRRRNRSAHDGHFDASDMDPDQVPIEPITPEEETWLAARVELVRSLAADEEAPDSSRVTNCVPILFLDLDDVLCLANPFGGRDALDAVTARRTDPERVYSQLFHGPAVQTLEELHTQLGGRIRYVISSTWREFFTRAQLRHVFREAGLGIVADAMDDRARWATPVLPDHDRYREIAAWLALHHRREPYAIVDDMWSGASLQGSLAPPWRIVLCEEDIGLLPRHLETLKRGLTAPQGEYEYW